MRRSLFIIALSFAVTLAVVAGFRLSPDALAIVIGLVLGILATIPATLLVAYVLSRQQNRSNQSPVQQPPVIVVNGTEKMNPPPALPALPAPYPAENGRKWTVIGDLETDD